MRWVAGSYPEENYSWVDFQANCLYVMGKGLKRRIVPLNAVSGSILSRLYAERKDNFVWSVHGKALTRCALYQQFHKVSVKAGIDFSPHCLRHLFATQMCSNGVPLLTTSRLLGHSTAMITEKVYSHSSGLSMDNMVCIT
jgi:site-specific recombinase XerD